MRCDAISSDELFTSTPDSQCSTVQSSAVQDGTELRLFSTVLSSRFDSVGDGRDD